MLGWRSIAVFLALSMSLNWAWQGAEGTWLERAVVERLTIGSTVRLAAILAPEAHPRASGRRVSVDGAAVTVLNGCDGTEVWILLAAAILVAPLSWPMRAVGLMTGTIVVFALNQGRLLALLFSLRASRPLFEDIHGIVGPLVLVSATLAFVGLLVRWGASRG